jgi:hypothetical protein
MMEDDLEESMMEADSMGDVQPLIKTSKMKRVFCPECVNESFSKQSNLKRHKQNKHSDQTESIELKRQEVNAYLKELRAKNKKDPVKREKLRQKRKAHGEKVKAQKAANTMDVTQTTDEDEESENEIGSSSRVVEAGDKVDCKAEEDDYESDHCLVIDEDYDEESENEIGSSSRVVQGGLKLKNGNLLYHSSGGGSKVDGKAEKAGDKSHHFLVIDEVEDQESEEEIGSSSHAVKVGDEVDGDAEKAGDESDHFLGIDEVQKKIGSISHAVKKGGKVDGKAEKAGDQSHHFLVIDEVEAEDFKKWIGSSSHAVKMGDNVDGKAEKAGDESDDCLENYSNEGARGRPLVVLEGGFLWWS